VILRLGHVELAVTDLQAAKDFYVEILGFIEYLQADGSLFLRATDEFDVWSLRLSERSTAGLIHMAMRVDTPEALDLLDNRHRELGLQTHRISKGSEPGQGEALRVRTADGHALEFYHEFEEISAYHNGRVHLPMRYSHLRRGLPPQRIDHINLRVKDVSQSLKYWVDELGFSISEYTVDSNGVPRVAWIRRATGTHDVALGRLTGPMLHHVAYCVADSAGISRVADLLSDAGMNKAIQFGPGRHGITNAFTIYILDPSGNRIEFFSGDYIRDLDRPAIKWTAEEFTDQGLMWWGHPAPPEFQQCTPLVDDDWP
jgi:catechol 2,3-dioxygenase